MVRDLVQCGRARCAALLALLTRFTKFSLVGGSGVLVNTGALIALYDWAGLPLLLSSVLAVELAIASNFYWNSRWTFPAGPLTLRRFFQFNLVSAGGMAITSGTLLALVSVGGVHYIAANLTGIALATVWNFGLNSLWTWGAAG